MEASGIVANGIGQPVRRKEDFRLLTGRGRFGDDLAPPRLAHAVIVRSPHAHARIVSITKEAALAGPGVLAVLTGADYIADELGPIPHNAGLMAQPDVAVRLRDTEPVTTLDYPMPADKMRFVGEPAAMVVAETIAAAKDAAELVDITYEPLPAVARAADALKPGAPLLWENAPGNLCVDIELGDEAATAAAFASAAHIVRLDTWVQRVTGVPMEPRTNIAEYDPTTRHYTLHTGSGRGVAKVRVDLAQVLGVPAEQVRCVCEDMGGNFGTRNFFYPEYALLAWAARRVSRPVKWTCERTESFLSDYQGRDLEVEAELALDEDGNFLALRGSNLSNLGGHAAAFVSLQKGLGLMSSVYRIPAAYFRGRGAVTNTPSTTPYRSAGRPEAIFVIERLIDLAAGQLGLDPVALRRRNMIPPTAQPYANPLGLTYDSGGYEDAMNTALALADWQGFRARRAAAKARGKLRGIGV
ncbi:MAG TPA: xanthine dehydrogenase family protein molybdopterin-binding subunit, partial [Stellaceae bacterium]|nr:xanthine dehydrogenase family protein molybdopterin-binding subunit [Stellaceae bacterium]